jgi:hypothetical protein
MAFGDASSSITLNSAAKQVVLRFVTERAGTLGQLELRAKLDGATCAPATSTVYAKGSGGILRASLYPVLADGRPDTSQLITRDEFAACSRYAGGAVFVTTNTPVAAHQELALVVANADPAPADNFFSLSFLYARTGLVGANGRNERDPGAADGAYGLDPRELVGWSTNAGATWALPGGPQGVGNGKAFIPTYVAEYADGGRSGQPYSSASVVDGTYTMVYPAVPVRWKITSIGASTAAAGAAQVSLSVDGVERANVALSGTGLVQAPIPAVTVEPGSTVRLTTTVGAGGLALRRLSADSRWSTLMRLGEASRFYLDGDAMRSLPLYPLPFYPVDSSAPVAPSGLAVQSATETTLSLEFQPATDDRGVSSYQVSVSGVPRLTLNASVQGFSLTSLPCNSSSTIAITASDAAGNRSAPASVVATTAICPSRQPGRAFCCASSPDAPGRSSIFRSRRSSTARRVFRASPSVTQRAPAGSSTRWCTRSCRAVRPTRQGRSRPTASHRAAAISRRRSRST